MLHGSYEGSGLSFTSVGLEANDFLQAFAVILPNYMSPAEMTCNSVAPVGSGQLRIVSVSCEEATLVMFEEGFIQLHRLSRGTDYTLRCFHPTPV